MKRLRVGVVGLGVGEQHVISYRAQPEVEVAAICDLDPERLRAVGEAHGVAARYADYRRLTEDPELDAVSICSYDDAHAEHCVSAFRNGKHVMVEKPVALDRDEAEAVLRAQQDSKRIITSNLILRQSPRFREVKRMAEAGEFGDIVCIEGDYIHQILWKITEGWRGKMAFYCVTYGGGIHLIDLMRWIVGQEVDEVCGMGNKMLSAGSAYRFEDTIANLLRFAGGTLGKTLTIFGPRRSKFHSLNVYGTKKTFVNDMPDGKLFDGEEPEDEHVMAASYPGMEKGDMIPEFIAAIREDREPEVGARDVFRVMDVCFAAWESVQSGRTVKVSYQI